LLEERLHRRGQDDKATIALRLEAARDEIRHCAEFNYVIINQDFATAVDDLSAIVRASRLRAAQQGVRHEALIAQLI
jgi:guanylate kinase